MKGKGNYGFKLWLCIIILALLSGCSTSSESPTSSLTEDISSAIISSEESSKPGANSTTNENSVINSQSSINPEFEVDESEKSSEIESGSEPDVTSSSEVASSSSQPEENSQEEASDSQIDSQASQGVPENFQDWVPYSAGSLETLADAIANGYVIYADGQYWASPEYANMLTNEDVVYFNDIAFSDPADSYDTADLD